MNVSEDTPRTSRDIGGTPKEGPDAGTEISFSIQVPQPYAAGPHTLTEGEASALNQTVAENLSNNLRAKVLAGRPAIEAGTNEDGSKRKAEPARRYTQEEVQALADSYLTDYEIGVRRSGSGEPRITDPVEREARKIARQRAVDYVKENGGKPADFDMAPITDAIFQANKDLLMAEGAKIVEALKAASAGSSGLKVEGIALAPKAATAESQAETAEEAAEA